VPPAASATRRGPRQRRSARCAGATGAVPYHARLSAGREVAGSAAGQSVQLPVPRNPRALGSIVPRAQRLTVLHRCPAAAAVRVHVVGLQPSHFRAPAGHEAVVLAAVARARQHRRLSWRLKVRTGSRGWTPCATARTALTAHASAAIPNSTPTSGCSDTAAETMSTAACRTSPTEGRAESTIGAAGGVTGLGKPSGHMPQVSESDRACLNRRTDPRDASSVGELAPSERCRRGGPVPIEGRHRLTEPGSPTCPGPPHPGLALDATGARHRGRARQPDGAPGPSREGWRRAGAGSAPDPCSTRPRSSCC
jgi:hypothetical protein